MVVRFGMDPKLGQVAYEPEPSPLLGTPGGADWRPRRYGEETAAAIDAAVRHLIETAFEAAVSILTANRALLSEAAAMLLAQETMSVDDLRGIAAKLSSSAPVTNLPAGGVGLAAGARVAF
jgi:cell division protease FtsH